MRKPFKRMAGTTGLEPAASAVTGQRSNQLNYVPTLFSYLYRKPACLVAFLRFNRFACINRPVPHSVDSRTGHTAVCPAWSSVFSTRAEAVGAENCGAATCGQQGMLADQPKSEKSALRTRGLRLLRETPFGLP